MFESITSSLNNVFKKFRSQGVLTEDNIKEGLREVRMALLEADVSFKVARDFVKAVTERAVGQDVIKSVSPGQQIVKIVNDELVRLMGPTDPSIPYNQKGVTVIMLCGLQGSGKTTTAGKLAAHIRKQGRLPMLVAADTQRPAAIDQLKVLGEQLDVPVFSEPTFTPPAICKMSIRNAESNGRDVVILDTAGRLHIDEALMDELRQIDKKTSPQLKLLVADAMTGQDAVNSAKEFNDVLGIDGVILTKLDGDARGGAALSIKAVTGKPIKFVGVGEKLDRLEEFHADRMAGRILGMGDVVSFVEKAQETIDQEQAQYMQKRLLKGQFTFDDFLNQLQQIKKMGPLQDVLSMIGMGGMQGLDEMDEDELPRLEAAIRSMTPQERRHPELINGSRRQRIADGSGNEVQDVNALLKQFKQMRKMMKGLGKKKKRRGGRGGPEPFSFPGLG
jgi:signal recognition particle subunit SRP54